MELTKEKVEQKIKELEQNKQSAIATVNAIQGAIHALQDLIKENV